MGNTNPCNSRHSRAREIPSTGSHGEQRRFRSAATQNFASLAGNWPVCFFPNSNTKTAGAHTHTSEAVTLGSSLTASAFQRCCDLVWSVVWCVHWIETATKWRQLALGRC